MIIYTKNATSFAVIREVSKFDLKPRFHCAQKCDSDILPATLAAAWQTHSIAYLMYRALIGAVSEARNEIRKKSFWEPRSHRPVGQLCLAVSPTATRSIHSRPSIVKV